MIDFTLARDTMVDSQVRTWDVLDPVVLDAMKSLPRELFVPTAMRGLAYADMEIPLGDGECMMAPKVEGRLLQALDISGSDSVLEIGTGTGYLTALLATLADRVTSFDIRADFTRTAGKVLAEQNFDNVTLETRDAATLDGIEAQYDCIAVTGSMPDLHDSFRRALKIGGRLFVIVGTAPIMEAQLHTRTSENDWNVQSLFDTSIPPLANAFRLRQFTL